MIYTRITDIASISAINDGSGNPPRLWICDDKDNFASITITAENAAQLRRALDELYPSKTEIERDFAAAYADAHANDPATNPQPVTP